ncbi:MAG: phage tail tape measure protein [Sphaerochaetaceae bacterium]
MGTVVDGVTLRIGADPSGVSAGLSRTSAKIDSFGARTAGVFSRLNANLSRASDRALTPMTAAITGGGLALAVKSYNDLETAMVRLANQANWSKDKTAEVFQKAQESSKRTGIPLDNLIAGMTEFVDKTGNAELAIQLLGDTAVATQAAGAGFTDMGAVAAQLDQKFQIAGKNMGSWFEIISTMGDKGAFTLADFARNSERLFSAAASGGTTPPTLRSFLALVQISRMATGSSEQATTAVESMFNTFRMKAADIKKYAHFNVFDEKGQMKDAETILKALFDYTQGSQKKLAKFSFDTQGLRMIQEFLRQRKDTGSYQFLEDLKTAAPEAEKMENVMRKFDRVTETGTYQLNQMKTVIQQIVNSNLAGPIKTLNSGLKILAENENLVKVGFYSIAAAAGLLGAVKLGRLGNEAMSTVKYILKGDKSAAGGGSAGPGMSLGVQRVFVVNLPGGGMAVGMSGGYYDDDVPRQIGGLGDEAARAGRKVGGLRGALNKIGGTDLGFGALSAATVWASGEIVQAVSLVHEWYVESKNAQETTDEQRGKNSDTMRGRYGLQADYISKKISELDDSYKDVNDPKYKSDFAFQRKKLMDELTLASKTYGSATQQQQIQMDNQFQIFIDSEGRASVESAVRDGGSALLRTRNVVTTKPFAPSVQVVTRRGRG